MLVAEDVFFNVIPQIGYVPFEQTRAWKNFKENPKVKFVYFIDNPQDPCIACWGRIYRFRFVGEILDICGEVRRENTSIKQITKFFQSILEDEKPDLVTYNSISPYDCNFDIGLRRAGFVRPFGNKACPLTIFIDVTTERNVNRNWKRNLKKASQYGLQFEVVKEPTLEDAQAVSKMFSELKERKSLGFSLEPNKIFNLITSSGYSLCYAKKDDKPLCARIIYTNGGHAADVFAANSFESMDYSATHFIMEEIFAYLKEVNVKSFDFSRISPSIYETDSIYLFKDAAGGQPVQYMGEWTYSRKRWLPFLFCFYNFFLLKIHNY